MSLFPRIQSPCPYKGRLSDIMDGDTCRLCHREVHDLTAMTDAERIAFVADCGSRQICVSYSIAARSAIAAAALSAAAMAAPAAAQTQDPPSPPEYMEIVVGGLRVPEKAEWIEHDSIADAPAMPVIYEDAPAAVTTPAAS